MCKEDTILCCAGHCLTAKQKAYPFRGVESDIGATEIKDDEKYTTKTQKCLEVHLAGMTLSSAGIIIICAIWTIAIGISCYLVTQVEVDFKTSYFISPEAYVSNYLSRQDEYFKSGDVVTFYTDNDSVDYTTIES